MPDLISREIQLVSRPQGMPTAANFALVETKLELLKDEWVLVRNLYLSVDPYMRGRMSDRKSYVPPFELGKAMSGGAVGEVMESHAEKFKPGDIVTSNFGWREYFMATPQQLHLSALNGISELEPDLVKMQQEILAADHLVFVYPNWWATFPALLKGFIDRVFVPGFAFKYHKDSPSWDKLLTGKTARLVVTMDTPKWYYFLININAGHNAMKIGILEFCGIKPVEITSFAPVKSSDEIKRKKWLAEVEELGGKQK